MAEQTESQIHSLLDVLKDLRRREHSFRLGASGERQTAQEIQRVLIDLGSSDWHLLVDRRWPGTRRSNIDLLLVGPPGVVVLDVKNWKEARVEAGTLWHGQADCTEDLEKVVHQADAVASTLAEVGLAPSAVRGWLVLSNRRAPGVDVQGVTVVGDQHLARELVRLGTRLNAAQISALVEQLDEACPPATGTRIQRRITPKTSPLEISSSSSEPSLIDSQEIFEAAIEVATRGPIENWMVWLHPTQSQLATRSYLGPARIRGAAGTGKTAVALHRASHLARRPGARILFTSFVSTLSMVHRSLFERLAPDHLTNVEFRGIHAWSMRLLKSRGIHVEVTDGRKTFSEAWSAVGKKSALESTDLPEPYWRDEVHSVIKGRGLTRLEEYLRLARIGRRTPLREEQRRAVWHVFEEYEQRLGASGLSDWNDVLRIALESLQEEPVEANYTSVIVDEVQDLNCLGVRLVHQLVGNAPDGLLLVGDGQQSVYPGGFTLSEAGVSIAGRSVVLNRNYRNAAAILKRSLAIVENDGFEDLDESTEPGRRSVSVDRGGGQVIEVGNFDARTQSAALVETLRWTINAGTQSGNIAVLVSSNKEVSLWSRTLLQAGIQICTLSDYDGSTTNAVKIGTYQRAKGLEFACVFLPDHERAIPKKADGESESAFQDRAELSRRQLFVAMTRARDRLWLGTTSKA